LFEFHVESVFSVSFGSIFLVLVTQGFEAGFEVGLQVGLSMVIHVHS